MVLDGLRGYLQLANGLTDVTRERALAAAKALAAQGEAGVGAMVPESVRTQVGSLADDLVATSRANRDLMVNLVRAEVDRSVARLGLVSAGDLEAASNRARALARRVEELEQDLRAATPGKRTTRKTAKKTVKRAAKRAPAKQATAKKATARRATAKKATAKRATAKRATAKRATAKRATAKRATAGKRASA